MPADPTDRAFGLRVCQTLLRIWTSPGSIERLLVFAAALAAICCAEIYIGAPIAVRYGEDYGQFLDGGWRLLNGQRPHLDFYSPYGVFLYVPTAIGLALTHDIRGIGYANALMALTVGVWAYSLARLRLNSSASILAALSLALLASAPYPLGERPEVLSYAMIYNRQCYALLGILMLEVYPAVDVWNHRAQIIGGLSSGVVCAILFFLKPTYFLAAAALLGTAALLRPIRWTRLLAVAAGFAAVSTATLWYLRYEFAAAFRDLAMVAQARTGGIFMDALGQRSAASCFEFLMLLVCAILIPLARDPRASTPQLKFSQHRDLAYAAVVSLLGFLLLWTNWQSSGLPLNALFAIMLAGQMVTRRNAVLPATVLIVALTVAIPPFVSDLFGLTVATRYSFQVRQDPVAMFDAPALRSLVVSPAYSLYLKDGIDLLRRASSSVETVASLDFDNPFGYALQRRPFRGGSPAMQYGYTFSDRHRPSAEWLIGGADVVLVPKYPVIPLDALMRNYGGFLKQRFKLAAESSQWFLYRKARPL